MITGILNSWRSYFSVKSNFYQFIITFFLFFICTFLFKEYLILVESWDHNLGVFDDPFFLKEPIDLSTPIFVLTYGSILFFIVYHLNNLSKLVKLTQLAILVNLFRVISLFFVRFDAPDMIPLNDPILNFLIYESTLDSTLYNHHDLFFSGHTTNLFIISILYKKSIFRYFFLFITFLTGLFLVLQQVHYSIDVIFAPFVGLIIIYIHNYFLYNYIK
jgi:hypothetical protein